MECKLKNRNELISDYLMGELSEEKAKAFEEHYFQCEICFRELKAAEAALNIIAEEGPQILSAKEPSKSIFNKLLFPNLSAPARWGIAAAAAVIIILILLPISNENGNKINNQIAVKDTLAKKDTLTEKKQIPQKDFAAELTGPNFNPNAYQEEWINENIRSASEKIDSIISPQIGEKFYNKNIIFNWKAIDPSEGITLKIMNNLEKEIFTSTAEVSQSPESTIRVTPASFKQSGLYYWRLEDENEVLYVGKFYFLKIEGI